MLLRFPEPYDFELSTERFRVFGPDLANLWQDGALFRAVAGREVRITAAPGRPGGSGARAPRALEMRDRAGDGRWGVRTLDLLRAMQAR